MDHIYFYEILKVLRMSDVTPEMNDSYKSHRINRWTVMSILSERDRHVLAVGIEQMTINGVTRRQRQFQFILRGTPPT